MDLHPAYLEAIEDELRKAARSGAASGLTWQQGWPLSCACYWALPRDTRKLPEIVEICDTDEAVGGFCTLGSELYLSRTDFLTDYAAYYGPIFPPARP